MLLMVLKKIGTTDLLHLFALGLSYEKCLQILVLEFKMSNLVLDFSKIVE